ncbi:MAG: SDR family oxidoreductase [Deinococcota bacterium]|jgi:NAD(P)-dependent dehydrogenase (short-subunit alcohol dehydrogenase family)|nr:SDR family oxidoreductase [Deinococcota bacterium]
MTNDSIQGNSIEGKVALITGGSKGIGYGIAREIVRLGGHTTITARSEDEVEAAARELSSMGPGRALGLKVDVRDFSAQQEAVRRTVEAFGKLDVLVANAGLGRFAPVDELTLEAWHDTIDTNLTGVFYSIKAAVDELKRAQGYIITISSLAGRNPIKGGSAYNASKFGVTGFSEAVMLDLREDGVKVSTIMPGSVATHFNDHQPGEADSWKIQIEDIGKLVTDLLSMHPRTLPSKVEVRPSRPPQG